MNGRLFEITNEWIVPHNLYLCAKYNAHVNMEICTSVSSIKYIFKYVYKGQDRMIANVKLHSGVINEIENYLDCRYISSTEACWRIFNYHIHEENPAVILLHYHQPNRQSIMLNANKNKDLN